MKSKMWSTAMKAGLVLSSLLQILILFAVYFKGGGTTGSDPVVPIFPFVILILAAVVGSVWKNLGIPKVDWVLTLISGLFGSALPIWLEYTGSLVQYEKAIIQGTYILDKEHIVFPLLVFGFVEITTMGFVWYVSDSKTDLSTPSA